MNFFLQDQRLRGKEIGSRDWFNAQREMIKEKPLIKNCYEGWYQALFEDADSVPEKFQNKAVVELGSGSSFIKEIRPEVITSDLTPGVADMVIDGTVLPFEDESLKAIFITHVFHHFADVEKFLEEARRCLVPGGVISMVEVAYTPFSKFFFSVFHPEPFNEKATSWQFEQTNSMLDSNQALSWIVFERDKELFKEKFPEFVLEKRKFLPWFSYLGSGGVNLKNMIPQTLEKPIKKLDKILQPLDSVFAIHWHITIRKRKSN